MQLDLTAIRRLCLDAFVAAEKADGFRWLESEDLFPPALSASNGTSAANAPHSPLRTQLCFGKGEDFADSREVIFDSLFGDRRLAFDDLADLLAMRGALLDVLGQFFGNPRARSRPAMVWITPFYFPSRSSIMGSARVTQQFHGRDQLGHPQRDLRRFRLRFDPGILPVELPLRQLRLFPPPGRHAGAVPLVRMKRTRTGVYADGRVFDIREENIGLAQLGDDDTWLSRGYYPGHEPFLTQAGGAIRFRVLVLARMLPRKTKFHADIDQLVLAFDPESGRLVDCNTVVRDFPQFIQHYAGLERLLRQQVQRSEET